MRCCSPKGIIQQQGRLPCQHQTDGRPWLPETSAPSGAQWLRCTPGFRGEGGALWTRGCTLAQSRGPVKFRIQPAHPLRQVAEVHLLQQVKQLTVRGRNLAQGRGWALRTCSTNDGASLQALVPGMHLV